MGLEKVGVHREGGFGEGGCGGRVGLKKVGVDRDSGFEEGKSA